MSEFKLDHPLIVALDTDKDTAVKLVKNLSPYVGAFKVGPKLMLEAGSSIVSEITKYKPVFVDNKYYDIPNTMKLAVKATFDLGASLVTVHAMAGSEALAVMADLEKELNKIRPFKILVVTILTSFSKEQLSWLKSDGDVSSMVLEFAKLANSVGLNSFVCSAGEASMLKSSISDSYLVTPGIRFQGDSSDDQKRVFDPNEALALGSDALVMGRSIYNGENPIDLISSIKLL